MVNAFVWINRDCRTWAEAAKSQAMKLNDTSSLLAFLKSRKSASAKAMGGPGPSVQQLEDMLQLAIRVPDHGKLAPWHLVVFAGAARAKVGEAFKARWAELSPTHGPESLDFQAKLFTRAPVVVAVISKAAEHPKIPIWEQQLSAAAICFNLVLAAQIARLGLCDPVRARI